MAHIQFSSVVLKLSHFSDFSAAGFHPGSYIVLGCLVTSLPFSLEWHFSLPLLFLMKNFEKCRSFLQNVVQFGFVWCFLMVQFRLCFYFFGPCCMAYGRDLSSPARDGTCVLCIGKWSLHPWTFREVPGYLFFQQEYYRSNAVSFSGHRIGRYVMLIHPFIGDINLDYLVKVVSPTKLLHCSYWDVIMEGFGREILSDCISNLWSIHSSSEV